MDALGTYCIYTYTKYTYIKTIQHIYGHQQHQPLHCRFRYNLPFLHVFHNVMFEGVVLLSQCKRLISLSENSWTHYSLSRVSQDSLWLFLFCIMCIPSSECLNLSNHDFLQHKHTLQGSPQGPHYIWLSSFTDAFRHTPFHFPLLLISALTYSCFLTTWLCKTVTSRIWKGVPPYEVQLKPVPAWMCARCQCEVSSCL